MKTSDKNGNDFLVSGEKEKVKCGQKAMKVMVILVAFVAISCFVFSFHVTYDISLSARERKFGLRQPKNGWLDSKKLSRIKIDKLLGGLLNPGFDHESCLSRYSSALYRKSPGHDPSSALVSKLRNYEALHKRCGPDTESYRKAVEQLRSGKQSDPLDCNYIVWVSYSGLGNRILTIASAFLYALVTNRVLLVDRSNNMTDLFCEPFLQTSWLLPTDFPLISQIGEFNQKLNQSYGNMLKTNVFNNISDESLPSSLYLYMGHDYDAQDMSFFCDQDQYFFRKVPWLIIKTNNYIIPSIFSIPSFQQDLSNIFPKKDHVFHHLGRYLFHPTNQVWGMVTRFYEAYLEHADENIGVQIRVFDARVKAQDLYNQVLSCLLKEGILPEITKQEHTMGPAKKRKAKAVIVTSLDSVYFEKLRDMYYENSTATGDIISVFQPSHEQYEQNQKKMHNLKACAEIYLLSLTDKLITSTWSTFGYVAQGLGGLKPWILYRPKVWNEIAPNPACQQGISLEPCLLRPPNYDCKTRASISTSLNVSYLKTCEDVSDGIKLTDVEA